MPEYSKVMIGTKASGTSVSSVMESGKALSRRTLGKTSKKSSREIFLGTTTNVSMSEPMQKD